jgi:hypothetical protein
MDALTPAWRLLAALSTQVSLFYGPYLPTLPSPTTPRRPACLVWFYHAGLPETVPCGYDLIPMGNQSVTWASPFPSRLATTTGRIAFVLLRTSRSPPVALHPASRRRSYLRLRGSDRTATRTCTLPIEATYKRTGTCVVRTAESNRGAGVWPDEGGAGIPPLLAAWAGENQWRMAFGVLDP